MDSSSRTPAVAVGACRVGRPHACSEQGDTLVEVLMAIVIISLTTVALLGGLVTSITASGEHQSLATIDSLMKSYAEEAKYQIELHPGVAGTPSGPIYQDCSGSGSGSANAILAAYQAGVQFTYPTGYSKAAYPVSITALQPWSTKLNSWDPTGCPTANHDANGLQLLTIQASQVDLTDHVTIASDQMQIVVRNPDYPSATPNPYAGF